ncbi:MAG: ChaB family protein, partial [Omnitrophica WOR_2 bacterium]
MPYKEIDDLPERVRGNLPKHAQEIYLAAFNSAWDEYKS